MAAVYEVWDVSTGNLVGAFATEREALEVVRRTVERDGRPGAGSLALAREDDDGRTEAVAAGHALAELALREPPVERSAPD
ncbi:MAG TPA: hypothetical protein VOB72_11980 [Candidatus Dormibacteraeota bacterium]|nr:hypothetical protein [Candidatus Dormibacteraeota bacterium]